MYQQSNKIGVHDYYLAVDGLVVEPVDLFVLESLDIKLRRIQALVRQERNARLPIGRLPDELIAAIMLHCLRYSPTHIQPIKHWAALVQMWVIPVLACRHHKATCSYAAAVLAGEFWGYKTPHCGLKSIFCGPAT